MKIALAGNPNSGKTTMYNAITGKSEQVGNWAGVTVDKREAFVKKNFCKKYGDLYLKLGFLCGLVILILIV